MQEGTPAQDLLPTLVFTAEDPVQFTPNVSQGHSLLELDFFPPPLYLFKPLIMIFFKDWNKNSIPKYIKKYYKPTRILKTQFFFKAKQNI